VARGRAGLLDLLVSHGVPEPAARIFLVASREGPLTASELARATAIHRVHGYRFIRPLVDLGLLHATGGRPRRFAAVPVEELIDRWITHAAGQADTLRRDRERLLEEVRDPLPEAPQLSAHRFRVIEGQTAIHAFLRKRFGTARREILISVGGFALARAVDGGLDRALREAQDRGVRVRLVTEAGPSNLAEVQLFLRASEIRHSPRAVTNRAVIIDRGQTAVFVSGEEGLGAAGDAQVLLFTTDPHFVALAREYHQRLWAHSLPVAERLVALDGPSRAALPVARGQMGDTFQRLREITELGMAATGLQEVSIDLPDLITAVATQLGRQIGEGLEGRTPEEVARSLAEFYHRHARGRMTVVKDRPLTVRIAECFACRSSPEIGRVLCPGMIAAAMEQRLGGAWDVSKPDPTRHAQRGCLFSITPG
jgi:sugar-specific transcriptional regulator TrmB/predicted hydrocarbon binding protein